MKTRGDGDGAFAVGSGSGRAVAAAAGTRTADSVARPATEPTGQARAAAVKEAVQYGPGGQAARMGHKAESRQGVRSTIGLHLVYDWSTTCARPFVGTQLCRNVAESLWVWFVCDACLMYVGIHVHI